MASVGPPKDLGGGSHRSPPLNSQQQQHQGQSFQPMDKASSQTVKLNPKLELSHTELLKLLSYMEAELQARDVVIATLKTERIKSLLAYGRGGIHDPVLALQRDTGSAVAGGTDGTAGGYHQSASDAQHHIRGLQDTQLTQLEHLIAQQRKAHQRMRHVLRETEKRHSRVVAELEEERRKHEHDTAQGDDVTYALERDRTRLKQSIDSERSLRRAAEAETTRLAGERDEQRSRHKQMVLLLLEDRNRLAAQAAHHRHRADELAKVVSDEKGRMDGMAEGLEEESKKSLQMEAELEKHLAQFDTERQQMRALLQRRDDRVEETESQVEKLQRDVSHYQKQLQEAHNVAMFQQTLSVSPPRLTSSHSVSSNLPPSVSASVVTGITQASNIVSIPSLSQATPANIGDLSSVASTTRVPLAASVGKTSTLPSGLSSLNSSRPLPPQLPAKPPQLSHQQTRLPGTLPPPKVSSRVRAASPCVDDSHSSLSSQSSSSHCVSTTSHSPTHSSLSHSPTPPPLSYCYNTLPAASITAVCQDSSKAVQLTATVNSVPVTLPTTGIARGVQPARAILYQQSPPCGGEGCEVLSISSVASGGPQVVQLSPRVNVSASGSGKVITSSQGGKFTFQVSTTPPASSQSFNSTQIAPPSSRKPLPPARSATTSANSSTARSTGYSSATNSNSARSAGHTATTNSNTVLRGSDASRSINHGPQSSVPPPLPPNKPLLLATTKKDVPISLELTPHKLGPQTLKFGITISKSASISTSTSAGDVESPVLIDTRRDVTQVTQIS